MRTFLVVDDAATVRLQLADHIVALVRLAQVTQAPDARSGVRAFREREYDLTFVDGHFSDGTSTQDVVREMLAARPRARIVVVSSKPRTDASIVAALGVGAYAYLAKPVKRVALEEITRRVEADEGRLGRIL